MNPRRAFWKDLKQEVTKSSNRKVGCIGCLDTNYVIGSKEKGVEGLMKEAGILDVLM